MEQGPARDFAFHTLGWYQFQALVVSVLSEVLGQTVESASAGNDAGIDALFRGTWRPANGEALTGSFVAQAKFSRYQGRTFTKSVLASEVPKVQQLVSKGQCDHYLVFTNYVVSFENKLRLESELQTELGVKTVRMFGPDRITQWIVESPRLRMMVPRVYGLGDLSQILDERALKQARAVLESFRSRLETVVPTDAYRRAASALDKHRFVLLIGDPMTGKTTISYALALAALDALQLSVFVIKKPSEFLEHWNPDDPQRFFWVDDVFGQTQLDRGLTSEWNREFDRLQAAIERGARFIFTTRTYIWNEARNLTKRYSFPLIDNSQVHIYVERLTQAEKRQILYHHIRMGTQPRSFKSAVKSHLESLSTIKRFLPEAARRLGDPFFTKSLAFPLSRDALANFFEKPLPILIDIIQLLDVDSKALLAVMFARGGSLPAPPDFSENDREIIELIGSTPSRVTAALMALNESLVRRTMDLEGAASYVFAHPTVKDALAAITAETPEWLRVYLAGVDIKTALAEVSCGNLHVPGVRVIVPPSEYDRFLQRLAAYVSQWNLMTGPNPIDFLAHRCGERFLRLVVERFPGWLERGGIRTESIASEPWLAFVARLNDYELLEDRLRRQAVRVMESAAENDISFTAEASMMRLFTDEERESCLFRIKEDYLPVLASTIEQHSEQYETAYGGIEDYFSPYSAYCDQARELFGDSAASIELISEAEGRLQTCIDSLEEQYSEPEPDDDRSYGISSSNESTAESFDVFSDVDDPN